MINLITNSLLGDNILHSFLQKAIERKFQIINNTTNLFKFLIVLSSKLFSICINIYR